MNSCEEITSKDQREQVRKELISDMRFIHTSYNFKEVQKAMGRVQVASHRLECHCKVEDDDWELSDHIYDVDDFER